MSKGVSGKIRRSQRVEPSGELNPCEPRRLQRTGSSSKARVASRWPVLRSVLAVLLAFGIFGVGLLPGAAASRVEVAEAAEAAEAVPFAADSSQPELTDLPEMTFGSKFAFNGKIWDLIDDGDDKVLDYDAAGKLSFLLSNVPDLTGANTNVYKVNPEGSGDKGYDTTMWNSVGEYSGTQYLGAEMNYIAGLVQSQAPREYDMIAPRDLNPAEPGSLIKEEEMWPLALWEAENILAVQDELNLPDEESVMTFNSGSVLTRQKNWWLRTGSSLGSGQAFYVDEDGGIDGNTAPINDSFAVRPAFFVEQSDVLLVTPANNVDVGSKIGSKLVSPEMGQLNLDSFPTAEAPVKLTFKHPDFAAFKVTSPPVTTMPGATITIPYVGAVGGTSDSGYYVSAILEVGDKAYYTTAAQNPGGTGDLIFNLPQDPLLTKGSTYTIKVFNEQINGERYSDFSSDFQRVSLTIGEPPPPAKDIGDSAIAASVPTAYYTGKPITPLPTLKDGAKPLIKDVDYSLSYANNTNVGQASVVVTGKSPRYTGTRTLPFRIVQTSIAGAAVTGLPTNLVYNGRAQTPQPKVYFNGILLTRNVDYTLAYVNNVRISTAAQVKVIGRGTKFIPGTMKSATFRINPIRVRSVKTRATVYVTKGRTFTLPLGVHPYNATNRRVSWKSSNYRVVRVLTASTGRVKAMKTGTTYVTATSVDGGRKVRCKVVVRASSVKLRSFRISPSKMTGLQVGRTLQVKTTLSPASATNITPIYTSSRKTIATVGKTGLVTALKAGNTTISVKVGKKTSRFTLRVGTVAASRVTISRSSLNLRAKRSYSLKVKTLSPAKAYPRSVTWSSSNTKVATVSSSGKVVAKKKGRVTITCRTWNGKIARCTVRVT